jgi:hypothetical protein
MCAAASAVVGSPVGAQMQVDQGAGGASGGGPQPPPTESTISASISKIEAAPREGKQHLVVISNGYGAQLNAAVKSASNVGLNVEHLQSPLGFRSLVPHLAGIKPLSAHRNVGSIAEIALVMDHGRTGVPKHANEQRA